jgi:hypothetical protein
MGPAHGADVVSEHEGFATPRGVFAIAEGLFTCPGKRTHSFLFSVGDSDRGAIARARPAGQLRGVQAVGVDAVAGCLGEAGGATTQQA